MQTEFKRASWLELFFDIAFVALVAQLTYLFAEHHESVSDFINIFIIGYCIFIAWWGTTANRNLQPHETTTDKLFIQLQMVGAFLMSITMAATFYGNYLGFFLTFGAVRFLQVMMIVRMYYIYPHSRPVTYNLSQGMVIAASLWVVSAFTASPWHFLIAGTALAIDILTPLTRGKGNTVRYLNVHHLHERLGLFLMLVIGESMIVVALSNTAKTLTITEPTVIFSGLALMVSLWWLYFEHSEKHHEVRPKNLFLFIHAHAFLYGSLILLSVGYKLILYSPSKTGLLFVLGGVLGVLVTIGVIRSLLEKLYGRKFIISTLVFIVFMILAGVGLWSGDVILSLILTSLFFVAIAVSDYRGLFVEVSKTLEKN